MAGKRRKRPRESSTGRKRQRKSPSGGQHPAGKRAALSGCLIDPSLRPSNIPWHKNTGRSLTEGALGSTQVDLTLAFADILQVQPGLRARFFCDYRQPLQLDEVYETGEDMEADFVFTSRSCWSFSIQSFPYRRFHYDHKDTWQATSSEIMELAKDRQAMNITLRRSTTYEEFQVILVRILKGKATGPKHLFFSAEQRRRVAFLLFEELLRSPRPALVMGNLGMALGRIATYCHEYESKVGVQMVDRLKVLANPDQQLLCLSVATPGMAVVQLDKSWTPERMFGVQVQTSASSHGKHLAGNGPDRDSASGDHLAGNNPSGFASSDSEHLAGNSPRGSAAANDGNGVRLKSRARVFLEVLSEASQLSRQ